MLLSHSSRVDSLKIQKCISTIKSKANVDFCCCILLRTFPSWASTFRTIYLEPLTCRCHWFQLIRGLGRFWAWAILNVILKLANILISPCQIKEEIANLCSLNELGPYLCVVSLFRLLGKLMIEIASNGHLWLTK